MDPSSIGGRVLVVGHPSCGKTTLIETLLLLKMPLALTSNKKSNNQNVTRTRTPTRCNLRNATRDEISTHSQQNYQQNHQLQSRSNSPSNDISPIRGKNWTPFRRISPLPGGRMSTSPVNGVQSHSDLSVTVWFGQQIIQQNTDQHQQNLKKTTEQYFFLSQYGPIRIYDIQIDQISYFLDLRIQIPEILMLVYDCTNLDYLYEIKSFLKDYLEKIYPQQRSLMSIFVVASKIDLQCNENENDNSKTIKPVTYDLQQWFVSENIRHFYISSFYDKGIPSLRAAMFYTIHEQQIKYQKHFRYFNKKFNRFFKHDVAIKNPN